MKRIAGGLVGLVVLAALTAIGFQGGQSVTRGPYLQSETYNSIIVRWRTSVASDSRVRYGSSPANLNQITDVGTTVTDHVVQFAGLAADTTYYYSIGSTTTVLAGGDANHFFKTAPAPGTQRPAHIWVLGDSGTADNNARAVRDAYFNTNGSTYTDLILMLGDNAYNSGTDTEYQAAVFNMYPTILRQSVLWATLGNHDGISADSLTQSGPFYNIFSYPRNGEAGGLASGTEAYFSFEFGNIHFVNLESFQNSRASGGPMMTWLQNDLAQNTKQWTIAFWHHPPYSKGSHDSDTETELIEMRQNALPLLEAAGVDLVLTGHSHSYERSFLIDGHYGTSNTFTNSMKKNGGDGRPTGNGAYVKPSAGMAPHEGAVYAVAGSSGQASGGSLNHPAMFISLNQLGSMVLDVNNGRLDAKFLDSTGTTRDSFTVMKGGPPPSASGLTATPVSNSQINLAWTDKSNNEDSFSVEQSTDGVNFSQIAAPAANATSYPVTGLSPATLYYFRVVAVNSTYGNSSPSNVASATTGGSSSPTLTGVSPSSGAQSTSVPVTLTGTNFVTGATVSVSGTGVTATNVTVVNGTQITATFNVATGTGLGARNVTVTTPGGTTGPQPFTVVAGTPTLTSVSPSSGTQGASVPVTLTGTNFVSGATVGVSGTGITVSNVVVASGTQITATFTIASNATPGSYNVSVTTSSTSNTVPFTVNNTSGLPTLASITPSSGAQGTSVNVTLTGTNFTAGSQIRLSGAGLSQTNIVVVSSTQITATYTISSSVALGPHNTWVVTSAGSSNILTFTVTAPGSGPTLSSIAPNNGTRGSAVNVMLTGSNFVSGATVGVSGSGVTASNVTVVSATQITATLTIGAAAALGAYNISVTTTAGTSGTVPFTVNLPPPTLTSVTPNSGAQGTAVGVTLVGTNFAAGATVGVTAAGVTVSNVNVVSSTQITATFTIASGSALGARNVSVTTSGGSSGTQPFTIVAGTPGLTSVSPSSGVQGASVPVTLTGSNFVSGATVGVSGTGITVSNVAVVSSTQITATFDIASNAAAAAYNVSVTTSGGTSNTMPFTVTPTGPTLTSVTPNSGAQGTAVGVTLTGTNFISGATVGITGTGVTVSNVNVVSSTQITATFTIAASAVPGPYNVSVSTSAGASNAVPFTVNGTGGAPTLSSITPSSGARGTSVNVTLTGTNFIAGSQIRLVGAGLSQTNIVVVSPTQITATYTISPSVAVGPHNTWVVTSAGSSNILTFTVN